MSVSKLNQNEISVISGGGFAAALGVAGAAIGAGGGVLFTMSYVNKMFSGTHLAEFTIMKLVPKLGTSTKHDNIMINIAICAAVGSATGSAIGMALGTTIDNWVAGLVSTE